MVASKIAAFSDRPFDVRERPSAVSPFWGPDSTCSSREQMFGPQTMPTILLFEGMKRYVLKGAQERARKAQKRLDKKADKAGQKAEDAR